MTVPEKLMQHKIVAIIRGARPDAVTDIVAALAAGGIRAVEITLNSDNALQLINRLAAGAKEDMLVGAGTVLDAEEAAAAITAGAKFIISPSFDAATIERTKKMGAMSIPGAFTPTEILKAWQAGADMIKVFPAPGPQYIKDVRGPLSHIPLMPTGGINLSNIRAFLDAGARAMGIGTALVNPARDVTEAWLQTLTAQAAALVQAVKE